MKVFNTTFYKQSSKDIWDEVNDGQINPHCDCITNDDYSIDDIKYWGYVSNEIFD